MARGSRQKLKMLYLRELFIRETDEEHPLTMEQIIGFLEARGVTANRKTLYMDFDELRAFGMDINIRRGNGCCGYYLGSREFELSELKLLVDSVQAARFMTDKKSKELIGKLERLASRHQASRLQRQVFTCGRVKTMNESIFYNVDAVFEAIGRNRQIRFLYCNWNLDKVLEPRKDGAFYEVSPWHLVWANEYYYLVGYDAAQRQIKHYRVDKMLQITVAEKPRDGREAFDGFDLPSYAKSLFGMFGGEGAHVSLDVENGMVGILLDRFGRDVPVMPTDDPGRFRTVVDVALSGQFLGWIISIGGGIHISGPEKVLGTMRRVVRRLAAEYVPEIVTC